MTKYMILQLVIYMYVANMPIVYVSKNLGKNDNFKQQVTVLVCMKGNSLFNLDTI